MPQVAARMVLSRQGEKEEKYLFLNFFSCSNTYAPPIHSMFYSMPTYMTIVFSLLLLHVGQPLVRPPPPSPPLLRQPPTAAFMWV